MIARRCKRRIKAIRLKPKFVFRQRNCDGKKVTEEHVRQLANWKPNARLCCASCWWPEKDSMRIAIQVAMMAVDALN